MRDYFDKSRDLHVCGLINVFIISMIHRVIGRFKRKNFSQFPLLSEIATAFVAHRFFYVFDLLYNLRNIMRKIKRKLKGSKGK
jgi:hypothetical protein